VIFPLKKNSTNHYLLPSNSIQILHEDNHIIVVNKRPSDIVQGDKTGDKPLSDKIKSYLKHKYNKPGNVFLGVVHRLDRPTSGIVVFARTSKALTRLNESFRNKTVQKTYWAVVKDAPQPPSDELTHYLKKNEKQNKSYILQDATHGAKEARLKYKRIYSTDNYHLLEIELITGRHHQIRVQLSHIGCPIKGDIKYGAKRTNKDASIHLHARSIELSHPVSKKRLKLEAPVPNENLWQAIAQQIPSL